MCGLSAIVEFGPVGVLPFLLQMHDQIAHRGPDGEGFAIWNAAMQGIVTRSRDELIQSAPAEPRIAAAFRWLKIQAPHESAAQPMLSPTAPPACYLMAKFTI